MEKIIHKLFKISQARIEKNNNNLLSQQTGRVFSSGLWNSFVQTSKQNEGSWSLRRLTKIKSNQINLFLRFKLIFFKVFDKRVKLVGNYFLHGVQKTAFTYN